MDTKMVGVSITILIKSKLAGGLTIKWTATVRSMIAMANYMKKVGIWKVNVWKSVIRNNKISNTSRCVTALKISEKKRK